MSRNYIRTRERDVALNVIAKWLKSGLTADGAGGTPAPPPPRALEPKAGIESIIRDIEKAELNSEDAIRIISTLNEKKLVNVPVVKSEMGTVLLMIFLRNFGIITRLRTFVKKKRTDAALPNVIVTNV